ncbi:Uncharacterised protein [Serratia quinivorans]|uniref:hypothetical protein n=1 Tax=Serratia quinivorans TaxID=137545 RepID=UPI000F6E49BE|nr:hypothetical protein [Serratia quinivorans]VEI66288.1 Uncharacterised protein [Serratia quinivorans]
MFKILGWLLLTLLSSGGLAAYFLQQQYEEKSADFRIIYRDVTVKLSQHDAIIPLSHYPIIPLSHYCQPANIAGRFRESSRKLFTGARIPASRRGGLLWLSSTGVTGLMLVSNRY